MEREYSDRTQQLLMYATHEKSGTHIDAEELLYRTRRTLWRNWEDEVGDSI